MNEPIKWFEEPLCCLNCAKPLPPLTRSVRYADHENTIPFMISRQYTAKCDCGAERYFEEL